MKKGKKQKHHKNFKTHLNNDLENNFNQLREIQKINLFPNPPSFFVQAPQQNNRRLSNNNQALQSNYLVDGLIALINQERFNHGMNDLQISPTLMELARAKAIDWSSDDYPYFSERSPRSHISPRLGSLLDQARAAKYLFYPIELGSFGYETANEVLQGWLKSPGHSPWIIDPNYASNFTRIGAGYFFNPNSEYKHYWVLIMSNETPGSEYNGSCDPYRSSCV